MTFDFAQLVARGKNPSSWRGVDRRVGHGVEQTRRRTGQTDESRWGRLFLHRRDPHDRNHRKQPTTVLKFGDTVRIEMRDANGNSIFGAITNLLARLSRCGNFIEYIPYA